MRKFAIILIALCVVIVLALALIPHFLDVNHYRPRIQAELQNRLGRPVSLGNINASFLPPSLIVKDVVIGEDTRFGSGPFAKAQELDVRVALWPLLHKDLQVKSLKLVRPDIELIKNEGGHPGSGPSRYSRRAAPENFSEAQCRNSRSRSAAAVADSEALSRSP
jgi:AsmA protein